MPEDRALPHAGGVGWHSPEVVLPYGERWSPGDGDESVSLDGLWQPGNRAEDLEGRENQAIVAAVIPAVLA
jgi:hypothetical protein